MAKKKRKSKRSSTKNIFFRELESTKFYERTLTLEFRLFVENEIWPRLKPLHKGYKIKEKKDILAQIVHHLIGTGLTNKVVADSRGHNEKEARKRIPIWDILEKKKFCRSCNGSEMSQRITRYRASSRLLDLREKWELTLLEDLDLKRNTGNIEPTSHALVVLYRGKVDWMTGQTLSDEQKKKPQSILKRIEATCQRDKYNVAEPDPQAIKNGMDYFRNLENAINDINEENLSHSWVAYTLNSDTGNQIAFPPNVCLRQIHSGKLFRGTRLYSWGCLSGQGISKEQRRTIQIDGEPATEIDSHCHAIRLAYHLSGIDERGDVYWSEKVFPHYFSFKNISSENRKVVRGFVKIVTNIALNVKSKNIARGAIYKKLQDIDNKERSFLKKLIFQTENTNLNGILERIVKAHPKKVSKRFFTEYGLELMRIDGLIMLHTLTKFVVKDRRPALAIHDSLVIKVSDVAKAKKVFSKTYHKFAGFNPVLKRKF